MLLQVLLLGLNLLVDLVLHFGQAILEVPLSLLVLVVLYLHVHLVPLEIHYDPKN